MIDNRQKKAQGTKAGTLRRHEEKTQDFGTNVHYLTTEMGNTLTKYTGTNDSSSGEDRKQSGKIQRQEVQNKR